MKVSFQARLSGQKHVYRLKPLHSKNKTYSFFSKSSLKDLKHHLLEDPESFLGGDVEKYDALEYIIEKIEFNVANPKRKVVFNVKFERHCYDKNKGKYEWDIIYIR